MEFGKSCYEFCDILNIGEWVSCSKSGDKYFEFTDIEINKLFYHGNIYDGTKGGLVLGKLHINGGIHILEPISNQRFRHVGEMEGWEYISAPIKNHEIKSKFDKINKKTINQGHHILTDFSIPRNCKVINTNLSQVSFLLVTNSNHFIINRFATREHIEEIVELDNRNSDQDGIILKF